ncbi:MAG: hypothetical protein A2W05_09810 [Candidatus Schekmanbacteria bacterium RBG_16_38_10]|uniref:Uncharacterized protein n=1 Tax=Candidatus Schekmanbacteria bacterium RBG_16_38_10 TaxID=1817879 RepID=A0A1F7S202_9BACT|nr:MAG: hypothetical protein A2W05_09810 [Candidatus Schekmanbacteria bacterium RBG_16_38_10]
MEYYSMDDIKMINRNKGHYFFSPDSMRFFRSRVGDSVYQGSGGIYFVTSEQFDWKSPRLYTVRSFNPETGGINTVGEFNEMTRYQAHSAAKKLAEGK